MYFSGGHCRTFGSQRRNLSETSERDKKRQGSGCQRCCCLFQLSIELPRVPHSQEDTDLTTLRHRSVGFVQGAVQEVYCGGECHIFGHATLDSLEDIHCLLRKPNKLLTVLFVLARLALALIFFTTSNARETGSIKECRSANEQHVWANLPLRRSELKGERTVSALGNADGRNSDVRLFLRRFECGAQKPSL